MSDDAKAVFYGEFQPAEALGRHIISYWLFEYSPAAHDIYQHTVLPDGCVSLVFFRAGDGKHRNTKLFGTRKTRFDIAVYPGTVVVGVRFFPGALRSMLGISASALRDKNAPFDSFHRHHELSSFVKRVHAGFDRFDLLDAIFLKLLQHREAEIDGDVHFAVHRIIETKGDLRVTGLARECGIGIRQLQRKFTREVGLTLKEFARICRVRSVMIDIILKDSELLDSLFESGYFDQAHFYKDFSLLAGKNPTVFKKLYNRISHGRIL